MVFFIILKHNWNSSELKQDLYYQDMVTLENEGIIWYCTPNILKLRASNKSSLTLQVFSQKIWTNTNELAKLFWIKKDEIDAIRNGNSSVSTVSINISNAMFNSYCCSNANYYPLTSPIVIPAIDSKQIECNILSFAINKDDKKIYSYNVLYEIVNNTCTVKKQWKS